MTRNSLQMDAKRTFEVKLSPEETFLWESARHWRESDDLPHLSVNDWEKVVKVGMDNSMHILLKDVLERIALVDQLPQNVAPALHRGVARYERSAEKLGHALRQYLSSAAKRNQDVVVLKGLWLSERIYGKVSMRPGADIDILVREADIPLSIAILEEDMGYGRWWRPLLDDRYYQRHHLHQQRCNHDRSIWIEPHWRLDHPYTQLTLDYEAMLNRSSPGHLWGIPVLELSPPDLLLALSIHLVKHAVYLPTVLNRPELPRLILADGILMYFVDVAEAIRTYQDTLDWSDTVELARDGGAEDILGSVLSVCHEYLASEIPAQVLDGLLVSQPRGFTRQVMERLADHKTAAYMGHEPNRLWSFLLGYKESIIFRPIRLLDLVNFSFPKDDYLRRRYGKSSTASRIRHFVGTIGRYLQVGWDTIYFSLKRRREVRALDRLGYEWPALPKIDD